MAAEAARLRRRNIGMKKLINHKIYPVNPVKKMKLQNKPKILPFQLKNEDYPKNKPISNPKRVAPSNETCGCFYETNPNCSGLIDCFTKRTQNISVRRTVLILTPEFWLLTPSKYKTKPIYH